MIRLKTWESIRLRCRRDGEHIKAVARDEGISPNTVRKYLRSDEPPRSKPRERTHILDPFQSHIDELLRRSPRITAVRIGSYLRQNVDASIRCDESTLRKYVARRRELLIPKEAFVRACYAPGDEAQFDFSPVEVYLAGAHRRATFRDPAQLQRPPLCTRLAAQRPDFVVHGFAGWICRAGRLAVARHLR